MELNKEEIKMILRWYSIAVGYVDSLTFPNDDDELLLKRLEIEMKKEKIFKCGLTPAHIRAKW